MPDVNKPAVLASFTPAAHNLIGYHRLIGVHCHVLTGTDDPVVPLSSGWHPSSHQRARGSCVDGDNAILNVVRPGLLAFARRPPLDRRFQIDAAHLQSA